MSLFNLFRTQKNDRSSLPQEPEQPHTASEPKRSLVKEDFFVVGTPYYQENIKLLACTTDEWKLTGKKAIESGFLGKKIFHYTYVNKPVKLVSEPDNPEDKNAIAVYIAGEKVGHISREDNIHVADVLSHKSIKYITALITGGEYKVVSSDGKFMRVDGSVRITVRIAYS